VERIGAAEHLPIGVERIPVCLELPGGVEAGGEIDSLSMRRAGSKADHKSAGHGCEASRAPSFHSFLHNIKALDRIADCGSPALIWLNRQVPGSYKIEYSVYFTLKVAVGAQLNWL
jgi:hypothetical protein